MTLASEIIQRGYRESNLIPLGSTPSANQITEGLARLNGILLSTVGGEVSDDFYDINMGGSYSEADLTSQWVPDNSRLLLKLTGALSLNLDPYPQNGQRLAIVDVGNNLATYNVTLNGNGRNIENGSTAILNTNGLVREWMYRADTGNWVRISSLASSDTMPFPAEFDDYFAIMVAMRLNPVYAQDMTVETVKYLSRIRGLLRSRYHLTQETDPDTPPLGNDYRRDAGFSNSSEFNTGRPGRWRR